jgi:hypothetical protein
MTLRYSETVRNAGLDGRIAAMGSAPSLHIFDGSGEPLVTIKLPQVWMTKAKNGVTEKAGDWNGVASRSGQAKSFRFVGSGGAHIEGLIPHDMTVDNAKLEKGQHVSIGQYIILAGNAAPDA